MTLLGVLATIGMLALGTLAAAAALVVATILFYIAGAIISTTIDFLDDLFW